MQVRWPSFSARPEATSAVSDYATQFNRALNLAKSVQVVEAYGGDVEGALREYEQIARLAESQIERAALVQAQPTLSASALLLRNPHPLGNQIVTDTGGTR